MKILYIIYSLEVGGGVENVVNNFFSILNDNGIGCDFVLLSNKIGPKKLDAEKRGSKITKIDDFYEDIIKGNYNLYKILKHKRKLDYDAIHINLTCGSDILMVLAAYLAGYRNIITHAHTNRGHKIAFYIVKLIAYLLTKKQLACSKEAANLYYFSSKKNVIIPNFFDIEKFVYNKEKRERIRELYKLENKKVIGMVGRLEKIKNHKFGLEVMKRVSEYDQDVVMLIIGEGKLKEDIVKISKENDLDKKVIFINNTENITDMYNALDILLFPSLSEGLGLVLVEAQYTGLKCIASSNIPKITEISKNVDYLDIDKEDSVEKWAKKVLEFDNLNNRYNNITKDTFDRKKYIEDVINLYK